MMYNQKMAAAIKANGRILREHGENVYIPFGSEYSIELKNMHSVRALVNITIDGVDVVPGGLVIDGNKSCSLQRFLNNGNLQQGNSFKFIERTAGIEQHRGIKIDDGLIRISFNFEKTYPKFEPPRVMGGSWGGNFDDRVYGNGYNTTDAIAKSAVLRGMTHDSNSLGSATLCSAQFSANAAEPQLMNMATTQSLAGITAPGSVSDQKFQQASWFATEAETHVMVLRLFGETETGKQVIAPVTVKTVPVCTMCGRKNRVGAKFCTDCGSGLNLI